MKITKGNLKILVERLLLEDDDERKEMYKALGMPVDENEKVKGKIILGLRSISGPDFEPSSGVITRSASTMFDQYHRDLFDAFDVENPIRLGHSSHAFVYVEDSSGKKTTYSGKSGIAFKFSEMVKRLTLGRDMSTDEKLIALRKAYEAGKATKEEVKQMLETTSWGPLRKEKNWVDDDLSRANEVYVVAPLKLDTQEEFDAACSRIESAYLNYKEDSPYDPLPGTSGATPGTRNSNSFAYTLLLEAFDKSTESEIKNRIGNLDTSKLPGWGYIVKGLSASNEKTQQYKALGMPV